MNLSIRGGVSKLLVTALLLTPGFSFLEVVALISGALRSQTEALTPIYIKVIKDVLMALLVLLGMLGIFLKNKISTAQILLLSFIFVAALAVVFSLNQPLLITLAGLRWLLPVLVSVAIIGLIDDKTFSSICKVLVVIFIIHFVLQVIQLFWGSHWFGSGLWGLALRNPGMFLIPSTGALFSVSASIFLFAYFRGGILLWGVFFLSVAMTASLTGIATFFTWSIFICFRRIFTPGATFVLLVVSMVISVFLIVYNQSLLGRGDNVIAVSGGQRIDIFYDAFEAMPVISSNFGAATNSGVLIFSGSQSNAYIADSTYTSVLANIGIVGLLMYLSLLLLGIIKAFTARDDFAISIFIFIFLSSFSSIIFEVFPVSLLISVAIAKIYSSKKSVKKI